MTNGEQIINIAFDVFNGITWDVYVRELYYMYPGLSKSGNSYLLNQGEEYPLGRISFREMLKIDQAISEQIDAVYTSKKDSLTERFNKITYKIYVNGNIESEYIWDAEFYLKDQLAVIRVFPQWLNERMIMLMFESIYKKKKWDSAIFEFKVVDDEVIFKGTVSNKKTNNIFIEYELPKFVADGILEHHKETNIGELKEHYKPWNKLIIRCPHNDIDLDKDVEYVIE
jgi:hypothetical protein